MKSPIIKKLLFNLLDDVKRLEPGMKGVERDKVTLNARLEHEGIGFLSVALPALCDAVDDGLASGVFTCPTGFARIRKGALPKFLSGLLCEVFEPKTGQLKEAQNPGATKALREILRLFKKIKLSDSGEELLHRRAIRSFWDTDAQCSSSFPEERRYLLSRASRVILNKLENIQFDEILGKHGPGAVAESGGANQKWMHLYRAIREEWFDISAHGLDQFGDTPRVDSESDLVPYHILLRYEDGTWKFSESMVSSGSAASHADCARVTSVAKNSQARRTITIEPCWKMFIQQGLNGVLRDHINEDPVLSNCLALTDQSWNQKLALDGSRTGKWSTLDLSSASDLLSYELVQEVFGRISPRFFTRMIECRSGYALDGKVPRMIRKFAGMGNALTFPVQSVVFATLAMTAIAEQLGFTPNRRNMEALSMMVRVYGDDIIVPTDYSARVIDWIESFGLKVNRKKTFTTGNFRESCGLDAWNGYDVTPPYIQYDPDICRTPEALLHFTALSNEFWMRGLYLASNTLKDLVEATLGQLPLGSLDSGYLCWTTRLNAVQFQRWNPQLHRYEVRAFSARSRQRPDRLSSWPALLKSLTTPLIGRGKRHLQVVPERFNISLRRRWMPVYSGYSSNLMNAKGVDRVISLEM